jgi:phage terminase large subunit-like protein
LDPLTGVRRFRRAVYSVPKKFGKTSFGAMQGLYHLLFDPFEHDREIYSLAGDLDQALLTLFAGKKMIRRSPRLRELFAKQKDYQREIVYEDAETGEVHRWRALASDSQDTNHGLDPTLVLVDEGWQFTDYSLLEAVSLGPQRRCPLQLWTTYAGMKSQMVDGVPLYDLYKTGMAAA